MCICLSNQDQTGSCVDELADVILHRLPPHQTPVNADTQRATYRTACPVCRRTLSGLVVRFELPPLSTVLWQRAVARGDMRGGIADPAAALTAVPLVGGIVGESGV